MNYNATTYTLFSRPYLDLYNQNYTNIVTINLPPKGPLGQFVRPIKFPPLSQFKFPSSNNNNNNNNRRGQTCGLAISSLNQYNQYNQSNKYGQGLMVVDEVPDLFAFLLSSGYKIDTSLTKMMNTSDIRIQTENSNKIIAFITYTG
jgi:hypothetical protein